MDVKDLLCSEIDNPEDLAVVTGKLQALENRKVYMCFSADIIHGGHIRIIRRAQRLGKLTVGVLSDEAVASYKRFPLVPASERRVMFENIAGVEKVVEQKTLSYKDILEELKPDIVVHGDNWVTGFPPAVDRHRLVDDRVARTLPRLQRRQIDEKLERRSRLAQRGD